MKGGPASASRENLACFFLTVTSPGHSLNMSRTRSSYGNDRAVGRRLKKKRTDAELFRSVKGFPCIRAVERQMKRDTCVPCGGRRLPTDGRRGHMVHCLAPTPADAVASLAHAPTHPPPSTLPPPTRRKHPAIGWQRWLSAA